MSAQSVMPGPGALVAGRYRIEEALSRGGMGAVFTARHDQTGRRFALKLMSQELAGDPDAEARFMREARLASSLDHPAIIEVYDVGRHDEFPYMVMRLLEGESLGTRLKRGKVPPHEAVVLLAPVMEGIAAAHAQGIVHRDLKPDNIYLSVENGQVFPKVLDFGISKLVDGSTSQKLTRTGVTMGTPLYMSPEQVRGEKNIDGRTDVYSLGVILYEMLTGVLPFQGKTYADLVVKIVSGTAPRLREHDASLPEAFEQIVHCAIATSPDERYENITSMLADLRAVDLGKAPSLVPRISRATDADSRTPFSTEALTVAVPGRRSNLAVGLGAGALLIAAAAWALWPTSDAGAPTVQAAAQSPVPPAPPPAPPPPPVAVAPQPVAPVPPPAAPIMVAPAPVAPPAPPPVVAPAPEPLKAVAPVAPVEPAVTATRAPKLAPKAPTAAAKPTAASTPRPKTKLVPKTELIDPF